MSAIPAAGSLDIAALQAAYAAGELTPVALIDLLYARMDEEAAPSVWITRLEKEVALVQAEALGDFASIDVEAKPLWGIPFAVKDNVDVAGMPTTAACPGFAYMPADSASTVQALLDAGAICLGKVNLDQFATGLVGSRSPYGGCQNVFNPEYLSGGSSSGSAVAVASHYVSFSLGTDTAGSGRVPAALNNIVGLKPSVGLISNDGMVPACASLDCLSIFATTVADATLVRRVMLGAPLPSLPRPAAFRFGIPEPIELYGDEQSGVVFELSLARLRELGGEQVAINFAPFKELGDMLYGPFVVERLIGVGGFIAQFPDEVLPVTRDIIMAAQRFTASDAFAAFQRMNELRAACLLALESVDIMVTPTVPTHFKRSEDMAEPRTVNDALGIYTRFVNFIGSPVLSIPQEFRQDGLPFGISLLALPGHDARLDALGSLLHASSGAGMGKQRYPVPTHAAASADSKVRPRAVEARVAVVGAHMRGLALNTQLVEVGARYVATVRTAPKYRLYVLPNTKPERPGLVQRPDQGVSIELELWDMSWRGLGELMARVPAPLAIGTLETEDGELVKGFVCEGYAVSDARDISEFGGYRAYAASQQ